MAEGIDELVGYRSRRHLVRIRIEIWGESKIMDDSDTSDRADDEEEDEDPELEQETEDESEDRVGEEIEEREEDSEHGKEKRPKRAKTTR